MHSEDQKMLILAAVFGLAWLWWRGRAQSFSAALPVLAEISAVGLVERKVAALSEASVFQWIPQVEGKLGGILNFPSLSRYSR